MLLFTVVLTGALAASAYLVRQYAALRRGRDPFRPLERGRRPHDEEEGR